MQIQLSMLAITSSMQLAQAAMEFDQSDVAASYHQGDFVFSQIRSKDDGDKFMLVGYVENVSPEGYPNIQWYQQWDHNKDDKWEPTPKHYGMYYMPDAYKHFQKVPVQWNDLSEIEPNKKVIVKGTNKGESEIYFSEVTMQGGNYVVTYEWGDSSDSGEQLRKVQESFSALKVPDLNKSFFAKLTAYQNGTELVEIAEDLKISVSRFEKGSILELAEGRNPITPIEKLKKVAKRSPKVRRKVLKKLLLRLRKETIQRQMEQREAKAMRNARATRRKKADSGCSASAMARWCLTKGMDGSLYD